LASASRWVSLGDWAKAAAVSSTNAQYAASVRLVVWALAAVATHNQQATNNQ
jgi:hypothetical protein